jgi:hypothetical protein
MASMRYYSLQIPRQREHLPQTDDCQVQETPSISDHVYLQASAAVETIQQILEEYYVDSDCEAIAKRFVYTMLAETNAPERMAESIRELASNTQCALERRTLANLVVGSSPVSPRIQATVATFAFKNVTSIADYRQRMKRGLP